MRERIARLNVELLRVIECRPTNQMRGNWNVERVGDDSDIAHIILVEGIHILWHRRRGLSRMGRYCPLCSIDIDHKPALFSQ